MSIVVTVRQQVVVENCCRMGKIQGRKMEREGYLYVGRMRLRKLTGDCSRDVRKAKWKIEDECLDEIEVTTDAQNC